MTTNKRAVQVRKNRDMFENVAEYLKLFGHPIAVGIVVALSDKNRIQRNVGQLTEFIGVSRVSVSKMLTKMRTMGVVDSDRNGTEKFYYLCEEDGAAAQVIKLVRDGS